MGRGRKRRSETPDPEAEAEEIHHPEGSGKEEKGFFACYLLCSLSPRHRGHTYIGFTVNPRRRIRQHNGEITSGAWRTKWKRPWEMILCIYGFPTNVAALQFEWAWQHPRESLAVREAASSFKSLSGIANKIKIAYTMLTLPAWETLNLTVNFFSTKYMKHTVGFPSLPKYMRVSVRAMDELPCYLKGQISENDLDDGEEDECSENGNGICSTQVDVPLKNIPVNNCSLEGMLSDDLPTQEEFAEIGVSKEPGRKDYRPELRKTLSYDLPSREEYDEIRVSIEANIAGFSPSFDGTPGASASSEEFCRRREHSDARHSWNQTEKVECCSFSPFSVPLNKDGTGNNDTPVSGNNQSLDIISRVSLDKMPAPPTPGTSDNKSKSSKKLLSPESRNLRRKLVPPESDVINLLTPSSCIRMSPNKQHSFQPQIIDLTESPLFIQL